MESDRRIVIEILSSNGNSLGQQQNNSSNEKENGSSLQGMLQKIFHPIRTLEDVTVGKNIIAMQAYQQAKQTIIRTVDYYHNRYFSLKEDYLSETTYNNTKTAISKVTGFFTAVGGGANKVTAPMPGTILDVKVSVGQSVKKGDVICVLEAMKMENDIPAPCDGVVASINVQKGASVAANDVIATLN